MMLESMQTRKLQAEYFFQKADLVPLEHLSLQIPP